MMVIGNRRRNEENDEEVGSGTYRGEQEVEEQGEGNRKKTKEDASPLWKYVTKQGGTKGVESPNLFARIVKRFT